MKKNFLKASLLALMAMAGLQANATNNPKWLKDAVVYQIYPSSFMDTNGDGYGDLEGIIQKLDYVKSIGVNCIWLNPVYVSGWTDGGYDIIDFYKVDQRFGTNDDLVRLFDECHKRGIRVLMDLVAGHSSDQSEWFKQSMEASNQRYSDYYIWLDEEPKEDHENLFGAQAGMANNPYVLANAPRGKYFVKNYYPTQPALNYGYANPDPRFPWQQGLDAPGPKAVRQELRNILEFWFQKGADGFRVDMAASLVKHDPDKKATISIWQDMRKWLDANYPEKILVAEWANAEQSIIGAKFNIDFFFPMSGIDAAYSSMFFDKNTPAAATHKAGEPHCYFDLAGDGSNKTFVDMFTPDYKRVKGQGYLAIPTANHDFQRPNIGTRNTADQMKVYMTFFLTMPGVPFIYYGDEIGMKYQVDAQPKEGSGVRAGSRTPMQWTNGVNAGFSTAPAEKLYFPVDTEGNTLTVETQENDPNSLLNYVRTLLALRHSTPALNNDGDWEMVSETGAYPMIYKRTDGKDNYYVALNPSGKAVTATIPTNGTTAELIVGDAKKVQYKPGKVTDKITMKGVTAAIFKVK